jgi:hypothetical protein
LCYDHDDDAHFALRWSVNQMLREMRAIREDADYRPGRTVEQAEALKSLWQCRVLLEK